MAITWQQRRNVRRRIRDKIFRAEAKAAPPPIRYKLDKSVSIPDRPTDLIAPWEGEWCESWESPTPGSRSST